MPKVKKLPKWAIKQAGGINKKAWALARRGKTSSQRTRKGPGPRKTPRRRSTPRSVGGASTHRNSKPGWGAVAKMARTIDVFTGPAQGSVSELGFTPEAGMDAGRRYVGPLVEGGNIDNVKTTAGGIATGLLRNWLRSKLGIYRGLGQKKILSGVMDDKPEILATTEINPTDPNMLGQWNNARASYDRAYSPIQHTWDVNPTSTDGGRLLQSLGLDASLTVAQKAAEKWLNPMLPKGINF